MISGSLFFYQNWLTFLLALWLSFLLTKAVVYKLPVCLGIEMQIQLLFIVVSEKS